MANSLPDNSSPSGMRQDCDSATVLQLAESSARLAALDSVMDIMVAAFDPIYGEAWNRTQTQSMLMLPRTKLWMLQYNITHNFKDMIGKTNIGFAITSGYADEHELMLVAIRPDWQSLGMGRTLLQAIFLNAQETGISKLFLEMRHNNPAASFYHGLGFSPIGRRKNYYSGIDGQKYDAITLVKAMP
ncbi:MAG: GNAT family N-acetyltransferase [Pseudomonadota bacterium]